MSSNSSITSNIQSVYRAGDLWLWPTFLLPTTSHSWCSFSLSTHQEGRVRGSREPYGGSSASQFFNCDNLCTCLETETNASAFGSQKDCDMSQTCYKGIHWLLPCRTLYLI